MIQSGLVSVTFRALTPEEIVSLAVQAGVHGVEWGGDVHVLPGDLSAARRVGRLTRDAGLEVAAYGSYYHVGETDDDGLAFGEALETATTLEAPCIRVWAGKRGSDEADAQYFDRVVRCSRIIGDIARQAGVVVAFEWHQNTLTDTNESALRLLRAVDHENIKCLWQTAHWTDHAVRLEGLRAVMPWLVNLHVFNWRITLPHRLSLAEAETSWRDYLAMAASTGRNHFALLEFVEDDNPACFLRDAATLRAWLAQEPS